MPLGHIWAAVTLRAEQRKTLPSRVGLGKEIGGHWVYSEQPINALGKAILTRSSCWHEGFRTRLGHIWAAVTLRAEQRKTLPSRVGLGKEIGGHWVYSETTD